MKNTSLGFHTFSMHLKVNYEYYSMLTNDFIKYANDPQNEIKRYPVSEGKDTIGWRYVYEHDKGLQWYLYSFESANGFTYQGIKAVINPKALIDSNYIHAAQAQDLKLVEEIFNKKSKEISPHLLEFSRWSINRADHCLNIDVGELDLPCTAEQLMKLVKRADVPNHFKERVEYDPTSHRMRSSPDSLYLQSKSVTINFYRKYAQQSPKHPNYANREKSYNVLRFEVQCKYPKLYTLSKQYKLSRFDDLSASENSFAELYEELNNYFEIGASPPTITSDAVLQSAVSYDIVEKYIYKTIRKGDYFTLDTAKEIVESYNFRPEKRERLLYALDIVSESRGIAAAKGFSQSG